MSKDRNKCLRILEHLSMLRSSIGSIKTITLSDRDYYEFKHMIVNHFITEKNNNHSQVLTLEGDVIIFGIEIKRERT